MTFEQRLKRCTSMARWRWIAQVDPFASTCPKASHQRTGRGSSSSSSASNRGEKVHFTCADVKSTRSGEATSNGSASPLPSLRSRGSGSSISVAIMAITCFEPQRMAQHSKIHPSSSLESIRQRRLHLHSHFFKNSIDTTVFTMSFSEWSMFDRCRSHSMWSSASEYSITTGTRFRCSMLSAEVLFPEGPRLSKVRQSREKRASPSFQKAGMRRPTTSTSYPLPRV